MVARDGIGSDIWMAPALLAVLLCRPEKKIEREIEMAQQIEGEDS